MKISPQSSVSKFSSVLPCTLASWAFLLKGAKCINCDLRMCKKLVHANIALRQANEVSTLHKHSAAQGVVCQYHYHNDYKRKPGCKSCTLYTQNAYRLST